MTAKKLQHQAELGNIAENNISGDFEKNMDALLEQFNTVAVDQIVSAIAAIAKSGSLSLSDRMNALGAVQAFTALHLAQLSEMQNAAFAGPEVAPVLYRDRENYKENPADFLRRTYAPWLAKRQLTKDALHRLDGRLYTSFLNWCAKNGTPPDLDLPSRQKSNDALLAQLGGADGDAVRKLQRFAKIAGRVGSAGRRRRTRQSPE